MDQIKRMTDYKQLDANLSQISTAKRRDRKVAPLTGTFISCFKKAKVIPIFKKGSQQLVENYCPIKSTSRFFQNS